MNFINRAVLLSVMVSLAACQVESNTVENNAISEDPENIEVGGKVITLDDSNFNFEVLRSEGLFIVQFYADWCGPCRMLGPVMDGIAEDYSGKIKVGRVNVDSNRSLSLKYSIRSIPVLIYFKNGVKIDQKLGYQDKKIIVKDINKYLEE